MLGPWLEVPGVAERLTRLGEAAELDLAAHGTTSDAETIRDTAVAQPLIVATGLLALGSLAPGGAPVADPAQVSVLAGHSVGELTAAVAAAVLAEEDAVGLVAERGRAMAAASALTPTGMSAVLGGDPEEVAAVLARHGLTPANANGAGQVVAAGTLEQLAALTAEPPAKARIIPLQVAGAFHTAHMAPAVEAMRLRASKITPHDPIVTLLSNADGAPVATGPQVLARLVDQVSNPVRWDLCMQSLAGAGVTGILELPPAGSLTNLAKRALRGTATFALKSPEDLDAAAVFVAEHAGGTS
jgi:[acyl-carrier-protein] S-malonyltransferase